MKVWILLVSLLLLFAGCDAFQDDDPYPFEVLAQGTHSGYRTPIEEIIETNTVWQDLWQLHVSPSPPEPRPQVDFSTFVVVALFGGDKPTSGYALEIVAVTQDGNDVQIDYRIRGSGGPIQVFTQPFAILKLQKPSGRIIIRRLSDRA